MVVRFQEDGWELDGMENGGIDMGGEGDRCGFMR